MGEARRRGTLEQRVAQAEIRRQVEEARAAARREEKAAAEHREYLSAVKHREALFRRHENRLLVASLLGAAAPLLAIDQSSTKEKT